MKTSSRKFRMKENSVRKVGSGKLRVVINSAATLELISRRLIPHSSDRLHLSEREHWVL